MRRERERVNYYYYGSPSTANPAVIIQSNVQYVLSGSSTTLEARVFASPLNQAIVQWFHSGRLRNDATESSYTATSTGDTYRLTVNGASENEVGEYTIVVTLDGRNATDSITLLIPGTYYIVLCNRSALVTHNVLCILAFLQGRIGISYCRVRKSI